MDSRIYFLASSMINLIRNLRIVYKLQIILDITLLGISSLFRKII
jgi:hypothetical protein